MRKSHRRIALVFLLLVLAWPDFSFSPASVLAAGDDVSAATPQQESIITKGAKAVIGDIEALVTSPARMDRQDALTAAGAVAVVAGVFAADRGLRTTSRHNTTSTGLDVADGFSRLGSAGGLLAVNAGAIAIGFVGESYGASNRLKEAGLIGLEAQAFAVVASVALKQIVGRSRPELQQGSTSFSPVTTQGSTSGTGILQEITSPVREKSTGRFRPFGGAGSFPSTHATAGFAVATVFAERYDWPVGLVAYGLATAVAASRVYNDQHFASDVVAGALIGWGIGHFLNRRHPVDSTEWQIRPVVMDQGLGGGVVLGRRF